MLPRAFLRATLPLRTSSTLPSLAATPFSQFTRLNSTTTTSTSGPNTTTESPAQPPQTPKWPRTPPSSSTTTSTSQPPTSEQTSDSSTITPKIIRPPSTVRTGTVVKAGRMDKCVKIAHRGQIWDAHIRKFYPKITTYLVADPQNSLREGDVVQFSSGHRQSPAVRHVVEKIVAPFGTPVEARPPVLSIEEREKLKVEKIMERERKREEKAKEAGVEYKPRGPREGRVKRLVAERLQIAEERMRETEQRREEGANKRKETEELHRLAEEEKARFREELQRVP